MNLGCGGAEVILHDGSDFALPAAAVPVFEAVDVEAALQSGRSPRVGETASLGEDALTERVHMTIRGLPETEDGRFGGRAQKSHVGAEAGANLRSGGTDGESSGRG